MAAEITISQEAKEARARGRRVFAEIQPTLPSVPRPDGSYGKPRDMHDQAVAATQRMEVQRGR